MDINPRKICQVCNAKANRNRNHSQHYGAICCNNCRSFFRRTIQLHGAENLSTIYNCDSKIEGQDCDMEEFGKNHRCAKCRLIKCTQVGMDPLKVITDPAFRNRFKGKHQTSGTQSTSETQPSTDIANTPSGSQEIIAVGSSGFREQMLSAAKDFKVPKNFEVEFFKSMRLSIQMDFSEAISEIAINSTILEALKNFFTTENPFDLKVLLWNIIPLMNLTMIKFLNKLTILKSLNCDDQFIVTQENIYVVLQFCIFKFTTSVTGHDQLSWLLFNNIPERGVSFTEMNSKTLENLLLENGGIKNQASFQIYKRTCYELQKCLDGCTDNPLLILNLFLIMNEDEVLKSKLKQPRLVNHLAKVLQSILIINSEDSSDQKPVLDVLNEAKACLDFMNEIFPRRILETNLEVSNQIYLNLRLEFNQFLKNQILIVDKISEEIKPGGLDSLIQTGMKVAAGTSHNQNQLILNHLCDLIGGMLGTRSKAILCQLLGSQMNSRDFQNIHKVLVITNALHAIYMFTIPTYEDRVKHIYGLPDDANIGLVKTSRRNPYGYLYEINVISHDQYQDITRHIKILNPFLKEKNKFKIILLLLLTELDEYPVAVRFQTALLSSIFHSQMEAFDDQAIGPYLEVVYRVKEVYKAGKRFFDMLSRVKKRDETR